MVRGLYECLEVPVSERLELSNGWLSRVKARHVIKFQKVYGEGVVGTESCFGDREGEVTWAGEAVYRCCKGQNTERCMDEMSFYFDCITVMTDDEDVGVGVDVVRKVGKRLMVTLTTKATGLADSYWTRESGCSTFRQGKSTIVILQLG
ncbi:hypothetical protein PC116_g12163 [Phytophthora cactorum]|nr:hypothetical protein Pcac1_g14911 [Phytophthora cactorum]KAG3093151.1 hypothetical protein PC121_g3397 [Phytophthora cactorum]KAG4239840.1 hypothetical protein PC116_g12163 [Phytophthora cactorum]